MRRGWKGVERSAAKLIGGARYPANQGGRVDVESDGWVVQVKSRRTLSLAQIEALAVEMERVATQKGKLGAVVVKRSAGRGVETPHLIIVTESVWRAWNGRLPHEVEAQ
jgi:hypothetical protein